ncbi:hypothetical protein C1H46_034380 [Malus baccata]|uniref:Uncharacterized protein n=1 Tax=Malus baccata TaxID=106549 RepID=A0A540L0X4_MALBA|nr:hypothetical protein C1H46_034380 [Malus baccata]
MKERVISLLDFLALKETPLLLSFPNLLKDGYLSLSSQYTVHGRRILFESENSESISRRLSPFVSEDYRSFCNRQRRLCCIMSDPIALIIGTVLKTAFYVIRFVLYNVTLLGLDFMGWFIGWMVRNVPAFWILVVLLLLVVAGKILRRWDLCAF